MVPPVFPSMPSATAPPPPPWEPILISNLPFCEEILPNVQPKPPLVQLLKWWKDLKEKMIVFACHINAKTKWHCRNHTYKYCLFQFFCFYCLAVGKLNVMIDFCDGSKCQSWNGSQYVFPVVLNCTLILPANCLFHCSGKWCGMMDGIQEQGGYLILCQIFLGPRPHSLPGVELQKCYLGKVPRGCLP